MAKLYDVTLSRTVTETTHVRVAASNQADAALRAGFAASADDIEWQRKGLAVEIADITWREGE